MSTSKRTHEKIQNVDLSESDHERIEELSGDGHALTSWEAELIVRFAHLPDEDKRPEILLIRQSDIDGAHRYTSNGHTDASDTATDDADKHTSYDTGTLQQDLCGDIRRAMRDADRPTEVTRQFTEIHPSGIFRHAEGRCSCDTSEPATTSPRVGKSECRDMRDAYRDGKTTGDIMSNFERSTTAVYKHVFGRCAHKREVEYTRPALSPDACANLRRSYAEDDDVTMQDLCFPFDISIRACWDHLQGECGHDEGDAEVDVEPIPAGELGSKACADMRRLYKDDAHLTYADIAAKTDFGVRTIGRHMRGNCSCGHDEPPIESE